MIPIIKKKTVQITVLTLGILVLLTSLINLNEFSKIHNGMTVGEVTAMVGQPDESSFLTSELLEKYYNRSDSLLEKILGIKHLYKIGFLNNGTLINAVIYCQRDGK